MHKTIAKFFGQAQYMLPDYWVNLAARLTAGFEPNRIAVAESELRPKGVRPTEDYYGDPLGGLEMIGKVGVVSIIGPLLKGATPFEQWAWGFCAHENIAADLRGAVDQGAEAIVMKMNSPGGSVTGTPEIADLVDQITASGILTASYTEDQECSAAEYITGACSMRLATGSAIVGSIGTMLETRSFAKFLEDVGISYNIFTSGKYKAMGHPAKDLTPEQEQFLQDFVNGRAAEFKGWMTQYRPAVKQEAMQGQIFTGRQAAENGLIDAVVSGWDECLKMVTPGS